MKKHILLPALAWVGGIAGFALRKWELKTAFDPVSRLMDVSLPGILLTVLMVALAAVVMLGCRKMGRKSGADWFYAPSSGYAMAALAGGLVLLLAGGLSLWQMYRSGQRSTMTMLAAIMLVVGGGMAASATGKIYRGFWSKNLPTALMGPSFATLLWLVCIYQQHSRQPEVQLYAWQILSAVAIVLALYGQASLALDKGSASRTCVYGLLAVAMTPAALADGVSLADSLVWIGGAVWLTAQSYMLLNAAFGPERPERMRLAEEDEQPEDETELEDTKDE